MKIKLKTELMKHQAVGVEKLKKIKVGALYMEMGTGKTRTTLELIKLRADKGKVNHIIWLCPCSCKINLMRDIEKHAEINSENLTICGIETLSSSVKANNELMNLVLAKECYLIVDESNLVKTPFSKRSKNIERLAENCNYKLILNGTPITKNVADLFQQWKILDWRILGYKSYYSFAANHLEFDEKFRNKVRRVLNIDYITDKISPYTYQVRKNECLTLPDKKYESVYFDLTYEQTWHYIHTLNEFLSLGNLADLPEAIIYRTINALQQITSGRRITSKPLKEHITHEPFFSSPCHNPRIKTLLYVLEQCGTEKVIIWCKFTHEIEDILTVLSEQDYKCVTFYGKMTLKQRQKAIDKFENEAQILIANKACAGYGLNLQFCHNAIYYDNDYDLGTRVQSEDRLHRIGQKNKILIIDIVADCKIDERVIQSLSKKSNISDDLKKEIKDRNVLDWLYYDKIKERVDCDSSGTKKPTKN